VQPSARPVLPPLAALGRAADRGWLAWQWIRQLGFVRDSWTAPVDTQRLRPLDNPNLVAACGIRALLGRLPPGGPVPLFVFDAGYDACQLTVDLADAAAAVLVRLRSDRCFYADPPPPPPGKKGRPRRHGHKLTCADPTTWPAPTATHQTDDDQYGTVTVTAWAGLHPKLARRGHHHALACHPKAADHRRAGLCATRRRVTGWGARPHHRPPQRSDEAEDSRSPEVRGEAGAVLTT
jgi:hypothetical protein